MLGGGKECDGCFAYTRVTQQRDFSAFPEVKAAGLSSLFITQTMPRALCIKQSGLSCIKSNFVHY